MIVSDDFIRRLPKAELHIHIEGSFEPVLMFEIAAATVCGFPLIRSRRCARRTSSKTCDHSDGRSAWP